MCKVGRIASGTIQAVSDAQVLIKIGLLDHKITNEFIELARSKLHGD